MGSPRHRRLVDKLGSEEKIHSQRRFDFSRRLRFLVPMWIVGLALALGVGSIFSARVMSLFEWPPKVYSDPLVLNVTKAAIKWDVHYGSSALCGNIECHLTPGYPVSEFEKQQVLPAREFPLKDYVKGQIIYYRTTVVVPPHLRNVNAGLIFHTTFIWAKSYRLYVNGRLIDSGGLQLINAPIPSDLIDTTGRLHIAVRVDPGDLVYQGIANGGDILLGSREKLMPLTFYAKEQRVNLQLWFMIPKLCFALLFASLFLVMPFNREYIAFALFAAAGAGKTLLASEYGERLMASGVNNLVLLEVAVGVESLALVMFVHWFFRRHSRRFTWSFAGASLGFVAFTLAVMLVFPQEQSREILAKLVRFVRAGALLYGVVTAWRVASYLRLTQRSAVRRRVALVLSAVFAAGLAMLVVEMLPILSPYLRAGTHYLVDILFFLTLAVLAAVDFSSNFHQKEKLQTAFKQYLDPQLVDHLVWGGGDLRGVRRDVTILFADIRSFSTISEMFPAEDVVELLNDYLAEMVAVVTRHGGTVDKFIGDACMVVWGATPGSVNSPGHALRAAVDMRRSLNLMNARRRAAGKFEIRMGIGIHSGQVIAGEIGSDQKKEYTIIGDPVNATARIESLTKELQCDILVSESAVESVLDTCLIAPCGSVVLRGKQEEVTIYRLIGVVAWEESPDIPGGSSIIFNDEVFERQYSHVAAAGMVDDAEANLFVPDYRAAA